MATIYETLLDTFTSKLGKQAQPRPDIVTPGSTGQLENARPYTFLGRVGTASRPVTLESLGLPATDVPEEGFSLPAAIGISGAIKKLTKALPEIVPIPISPRQNLLKAIKYQGKVHTGSPNIYHTDIMLAKGITGKAVKDIERGFVDPITNRFFSEQELFEIEKWLAKQRGIVSK